MTEEENHLDYLKIGHYVVGGLGCLFAYLPLIHVAAGIFFLTGGMEMQNGEVAQTPDMFGWTFVIMGSVFFLLGQACAITIIISGRFLGKRKNYPFSFVVACILCALFPIGTILGVFTIIVLSKDTVKKLYT